MIGEAESIDFESELVLTKATLDVDCSCCTLEILQSCSWGSVGFAPVGAFVHISSVFL